MSDQTSSIRGQHAARAQNAEKSGPPKRSDRRFLSALIGGITLVVLVLIAFAMFSDFPGEPEGTADKTTAPPEDVRR